MALDPIPYVVEDSGGVSAAPEGAIPIALYGAGGGGGGAVDSVNGKTGEVVLNAGDVGAATLAQGAKADTAVQPAALTAKENTLTAGSNVTIDRTNPAAPVISASGGGGGSQDLQSVLDTGAAATVVFPIELRSEESAGPAASVELGLMGSGMAVLYGSVHASLVSGTASVTTTPTGTTFEGDTSGISYADLDNVPTTFAPIIGAGATQAVAGNDVRLTNERTPSNDSVTNAKVAAGAAIAQSKIANLTTDLAAKAPLASPAFTGTPTGITKAAVGLGNVDNTSDANKPISTAQATAINAKVGSPNTSVTGVAHYATVGDLPTPGVVGVIYFVDAI